MTAKTAKSDKPRLYRRSRGELETGGPRPIVLEYHPHKKRQTRKEENGEKYSEGLEDVQRAEADIMRVARRASKAATIGLDTYERERSRSAGEKKDGAIEDFPHNSAKALSEGLKEASEIPLDVAESVSTKDYRKRLRDNLRMISKTLRVFRI
jgi:hypothetical protein